jgi:hypothetical protein
MRTLLLLGALAAPLAAQNGPGQLPQPVTRDDSAEVRRRHEETLQRNPSDARAVYWLARLTRRPDSARRLYQRYTELEPGDAWGWMPLGDALLALGQAVEAESAWAAAARLAPENAEVREGRARFLAELGRHWLRAGRPRRAIQALGRSLELADLPQARNRLALARAMTRPAVEPLGGYQRDSDGNHLSRYRLRGDLLAADGARLGVAGGVLKAGSDLLTIEGQEAEISGVLRPGLTTRVILAGGVTRIDGGPGGQSLSTATGSARFRWAALDRGPVIDLAVERLPLLATPELAVNQVIRSEARGRLDLPVGPLRLRGEGRAGGISAPGERNRRIALGGAVVLPVGWRGELSLQGHRIGYRDTTAMGYFAPDRVETLEAGTYLDLGDAGPWSVALDLGAGAQRIARFDAPAGDWGAALRGWGWISYSLGAGRALQLELEGSTAPGSAIVSTVPDWKYFSLGLSLRWAL